MINKIGLIIIIVFTLSCNKKKKIYFSNGSLKQEYEINYFTKLKNGYDVTFNQFGDTAFLKNFNRGRLNGITKQYYFNEKNKVFKIYYFTDGKLNGSFKEFYKNGSLKYDVVYSKNKLSAINNVFDINGDSLEFGTFKGGDGYVKKFHDNGSIKEVGFFKNGYRHGNWSFYHYDGTLKEKGSYHKGLKVGEWESFSNTGNSFKVKYLDGLSNLGFYDTIPNSFY